MNIELSRSGAWRTAQGVRWKSSNTQRVRGAQLCFAPLTPTPYCTGEVSVVHEFYKGFSLTYSTK